MILFHPAFKVACDVLPGYQTATMYLAVLTSRLDLPNIGKYHPFGQCRAEDSVDEGLFGLAFDEKMQANQGEGLPPKTFFSQSSDSV